MGSSGWPGIGWEKREWRPTVRPPRADRLFVHYQSALPARIGSLPVALDGSVAAHITAAETAVARLDAAVTADLAAFSGLLIRSEAVASSKIEHLEASYQDVLAASIGARSAHSVAARVAANIASMSYAIERATQGDPFDLADLLAIHRVLMREDPNLQERASAGVVRTEQNWIGGSDYSPRGATYVPPRPELLPDLLEDLTAFVSRTDLPAIVQAAVAHAQFETLHPFTDGNGRAGRALVQVILRRRGSARTTCVPIATALLADPDAYFAGIGAYQSGDLDGWLTGFARATTRAATSAGELAHQLDEITAEWRERVRPRSGSSVAALLQLAARQPVLSIDQLRTALPAVADTSIYNAVDRLTAANVLTEVTGQGRNRVWTAPDILDLLHDFERATGRRRPPSL